MDHQDWTTVVLGKKKKQAPKPGQPGYQDIVVKSTQTNKQNKPQISSSKIEQKMEEGTFELPKVTHNLQQQLQQSRQAKNLTQKQLAQACNMTESVVKSYESGKAVPTQQDLDKMSKALGVRLKNK